MLWKCSIILLLSSSCSVNCSLDEIVEAEIVKAEKTIMKAVVRAISELNGSSNHFDETIRGLIEGSLERAEEMVLSASLKIDYLVKMANENGLVVGECVQNVDEDMKQVLDLLKEAENECVSDKKSRIEGLVINASHEVNYVRILFLDIFFGDLRVCRAIENCLGDLLMRVVATRAYAPLLVKTRSSGVKTIMDYLERAVSVCSKREEMDASHRINEIMMDSALCVHKMMPELRLNKIIKLS